MSLNNNNLNKENTELKEKLRKKDEHIELLKKEIKHLVETKKHNRFIY